MYRYPCFKEAKNLRPLFRKALFVPPLALSHFRSLFLHSPPFPRCLPVRFRFGKIRLRQKAIRTSPEPMKSPSGRAEEGGAKQDCFLSERGTGHSLPTSRSPCTVATVWGAAFFRKESPPFLWLSLFGLDKERPTQMWERQMGNMTAVFVMQG